MRILVVTDAWAPQVNGVVRTLQSVRQALERSNHEVEIISPDLFRSIPCPTYSEIRLALATPAAIGRRIEAFAPDALHIATEGPLGASARRWCVKQGLEFTTAYHTQFPDYLAKRTKLPPSWFWRYIRWFHRPAQAILVSTKTIAGQLHDKGLPQTRQWGRGVDLECFSPEVPRQDAFEGRPRPIQLYVGRVAVEKNIEAFLENSYPGTKFVVGDGPALAALKRLYPEAVFLGSLQGEALASAYASADVFVFPSRTDTFGLVMIESLACGTPVAAFPVAGPLDVLTEDVAGIDEDLSKAIGAALERSRPVCAAYGQGFSWEASARQFENALIPMVPNKLSGLQDGRCARGQHFSSRSGSASPASCPL